MFTQTDHIVIRRSLDLLRHFETLPYPNSLYHPKTLFGYRIYEDPAMPRGQVSFVGTHGVATIEYESWLDIELDRSRQRFSALRGWIKECCPTIAPVKW